MIHLKKIILPVSLAINLILIGLITKYLMQQMVSVPNQIQKYPFLSKRIFAEHQNDLLINLIPLRTALREYVEKINRPIGIYFEYLPTGVSIGINEKDSFVMASLLKVPVVMAVYRQIELGNLTFDQQLTVAPEMIDEEFGKFWKKGAGIKISVREAIRLTLTKSDNTAKNVLFYNLPAGAIEDVFDNLDIPKETQEKLASVNPKNYTSMLRSLYLSAYLTKDHSNEILQLLSRTDFYDKLPAGVPQTIPVSHKIGVYAPDDPDRSLYSDCGIVYLPQRPYALCLMIRSDEDTARQVMKTVSKMIYKYISALN